MRSAQAISIKMTFESETHNFLGRNNAVILCVDQYGASII